MGEVGGWGVNGASQLLTSNLKECKAVARSLKQELQKIHKAPEAACKNVNVRRCPFWLWEEFRTTLSEGFHSTEG